MNLPVAARMESNEAREELLLPPNRPMKCTWKPRATDSPHTYRSNDRDRMKVLPSIIQSIGQTPIVRLNTIPKLYGIKCTILAKCEFMNPGGSVKDRIGQRMVEDAEEKGLLTPGCTIIEPTSGNTGIGLALVAAVKGYKCIIVMPEKMSNEKAFTLESLGAEIVRTPTEAPWDSPEGHIATSQRLQRQIPGSVILDQYTNSSNPLAHYDTTGAEIWEQCEGKVDYVVAGAGTGGSITGIGRKLKELSPNTKIIGADPVGSVLADPQQFNSPSVQLYDVEGIGYDFIPTVLDRSLVHRWIKTRDNSAFRVARQLIKKEGLMCGGSSGSAVVAALTVAQDLPEDKIVVAVLPDGMRNYMTKFVSDLWMESRYHKELSKPTKSNQWWWDLPVSKMPFKKPVTLDCRSTCQDAMAILRKGAFHQLPVLDYESRIKGFITRDKLLSSLLDGDVKKTDPVERILVRHYRRVTTSLTLGRLSRILQADFYAVVLDEHKCEFVGIVTQTDLMNFILKEDVS